MYEESSGDLIDTLTTVSPEVFSADTIAAILSLTTGTGDASVSLTEVTASASGEVTVASGTEIAYVSAPADATLVLAQDIPVVLFQGTNGVNATFTSTGVGSADGIVDRIVMGTAGADNIVIDDAKNSQVTAGAGDTIVAGAGSDTIIAGMGDSTVVGGEGYAIVQLGGAATDYAVTVVNGQAVVTGNGSTTTIGNINYVALDNNDALIFAANSVEAAVSTLYETTFGRAADAYGLEFWFDRARDGVSMNAIANGFINSEEYAELAEVTNEVFINNLFLNTFGSAATTDDMTLWLGAMEAGQDRADLIEAFAEVAGDMIASGEGAEVIGSVTIVPGLI